MSCAKRAPGNERGGEVLRADVRADVRGRLLGEARFSVNLKSNPTLFLPVSSHLSRGEAWPGITRMGHEEHRIDHRRSAPVRIL